VSASDSSTTSLSGVQAQFGDLPAPLLYVSSTQVNLAVPKLPFIQQFSPITLSVSGATAGPRGVPLVFLNPTLFQNTAFDQASFSNYGGSLLLALNADGSVNSPATPAHFGSQISVFLNGLVPDPDVTSVAIQLFAQGWTPGQVVPLTPFVSEVSLLVPPTPSVASGFSCPKGPSGLCSLDLSLYYGGDRPTVAPVGSAPGAVIFAAP
jgi:uncharacterized protein (TIGR03437 family)